MSNPLDELRDLDRPLVVYVGDALPRAAGLPSRRALVDALLAEATDHLPSGHHQELVELARGSELGGVFSELQRALTPATFGRIIERLLDDDAVEVPALGRALAGLRQRIRGVITPNLDHLVERSFEGRLAVHAQPVADLASRSGWLLKLHGTLRDRSTWVLTEEQQGRLLHRDPMYQGVFRSLFLAHPILFVGTQLDDPVLGEQLRQVQALSQGQPPRHWALASRDETGPIRRRQLAAAGVELLGYDDDADRIAMLESLAVGSTPRSTRPAAPTSAAPPPATPPPPAPPPVANPARLASTDETATRELSMLFVAANPAGTDPLRLDRELRIIREAIERSRHRVSLRLQSRSAATVHDLRRALLDERYDLVHISGHGEQEGLVLEDERGDCVQVPRRALARLFARYSAPKGPLQCVVLNACWSRTTGEEPSMGVPFTVAMDGPISDRGALEFSRGFYDALGAGLGYEQAHAEGLGCVELVAPDVRFEAVLLRVDADHPEQDPA